MKNSYEGLSASQAFDLLNRNVLLAADISVEQQDSAHATLDEIGTQFKPYARSFYRWEIPDHVWPVVDDELQTVILGGSLARAGWDSRRREARPRDLIYPDIRTKLSEPGVATKAADLLVATNKEHMRLSYVPESLLPTIVHIHQVASPEQQLRIRESWGATRWGDRTLDSDDPHPLSGIVRDNTIPGEMKVHAINLALEEIEAPGSRHKLRGMLLTTHKNFPDAFTEEQVRRIRRANNIPEDDEDYNLHLQTIAERQEQHDERLNEISEASRAMGKTVLDATMSSVKSTLANRWWEIKRKQAQDKTK